MDTPPKKNTQKSESPTSKSRLEASSSSDPTNVVEPREDKYTSNEEVAPETEVEKYVSMGKVASTEMKLPKEEISPETEVCVDTGVGMPTILPDLKNESQSSDYEVNSAAIMSSKEKRVKLNPDEGESWKICNCQMSKCLKLYCKCFSAGVYCTETCSCVDCFNRPIHKDTILATRKKTESRNPGAFAPKVLSRIKSCKICNCKTCTCLKLSNNTHDDSNNTPAPVFLNFACRCKKVNCLKFCGCYKGGVGCSIRCKCEGCKNKFGRKDASALHKRGCNCKKSNCRNRYCECYQRGVGCSINCSCEGCQNEFGRNDG